MNSYIRSSELNERLEKMGLRHFVLNAANRDIDQPFHWSDLLVPENAKKLWGILNFDGIEKIPAWIEMSEQLLNELQAEDSCWGKWLNKKLTIVGRL